MKNKTHYIIIFILVLLSTGMSAQIIELESTTEGFLPPRMTTAQRQAITTASDGMMIFNIDSGMLNFYDGNAQVWRALDRGPHISVMDYFLALPNGLQTLLDAGEAPINIINAGVATTDFIGLNYAGGIIFYMLADGTGLVAATADQSLGTEWGCNGTDLPAVTNVQNNPPAGLGAEIGDGMTNTANILSVGNCPTAPAALACTDYMEGDHIDWFLPSINEVYEMYSTIGPGAVGANNNIGDFDATSIYRSSSEFDDFNAWGQYFSDGNQTNISKGNYSRVRAIRAFN